MNLTSKSLFILSASIVAASATASAQSTETYRVTANTLNVRSGPSTSNRVVDQVKKGDLLKVMSIQNGWAYVEHNNDMLYVYASYLEKAPTASAPGTAGTYETTTGLNLRSGPSTNNRILTEMPQGARVQVTGSSGAWMAVTYQGTSGYAHGDYLRKVASAPTPTPPQTTPRPTTPRPTTTRPHVASYRVKTPYSVARSAPRRSASEVTTLRRGDRFRSTRSALNGYYIGFTFEGRTAWVVKTSLDQEESLNTVDRTTGKPTPRTLFRLKRDLDLVAGPTGARKRVKLGRVRRNQLVTGTRHYDPRFFLFRAWRLVSVDGRSGWVQARYLSTYKPVDRPKPAQIDTRSGKVKTGTFLLNRATRMTTKPGGGKAIGASIPKGTLLTARREARTGFFLFKKNYTLVARNGRLVGWVRSNSLIETRR